VRTVPETIRFRPAPSAFAVWGTIFGVPLIIVLATAQRRPAMWAFAMLCGVALIGSWVWLASIKLAISTDEICYETLLHSTTLRFSELESVTLEAGRPTYRDKFRPTLRLVVRPKVSTGKASFDVNAKVFNPRDIETLVRTLQTRLERL